MTDLFGNPPPERAYARTTAERRRQHRRASSIPRGYAAVPGTGPSVETCGSCKHLARIRHARTYIKCGLMEAN